MERFKNFNFTKLGCSFVVIVCVYFFVLFILSCYDEMNTIQEQTNYYNQCSEEEFERKVAELVIEFKGLPSFNFYMEKNNEVFFVAAVLYKQNPYFREICYRCGVKQRLEKNFAVLF